jgi:phospholipase C
VPPDPVQHVVVLMLENHSFDQMLGAFQPVFPGLEGVDPANPRSNTDTDGRSYPQAATAATRVSPDPMHELPNVLRQLGGGNAGFVRDYSEHYPDTTPAQRQQVMGYYAVGALPALHELARHFTVCDRWYSSVPGPTWANRFFAHSGTSLGRLRMPQDFSDLLFHPGLVSGYDQDTVFDRLNERGVPWRVYFGDVPHSLVLRHQRTVPNASRYEPMPTFYHDAAGPEGDFPAYSFIEPRSDHRSSSLTASMSNASGSNSPPTHSSSSSCRSCLGFWMASRKSP